MNRQVVLKEVNAHLICVLCGGYFIDATTIVECIHSFCRSCIVKHLENSLYCPICEVMVDKSRPLNNLRPDPLLQNIVNKVVPDLLQNELKRKAKFYEDSPESKEVDDLINMHRMIYNNTDSIYVSICNCQEPTKKWELRCSSAMPLKHLKKLVIGKFGLDSRRIVVEFLLEFQRLHEDLTLLQISYMDATRTPADKCLNLMYSILKVEKSPKKDCKLVDSSIADSKPSVDKEIQLAITEGGVMSMSVNCAGTLDEVIASSTIGLYFTDQPTCVVNQTASINNDQPSVSPKMAVNESPESLKIVELPLPAIPVTDQIVPPSPSTPVINKSAFDHSVPPPLFKDNLPQSSSVSVIPQSTSTLPKLITVSAQSIPAHVSAKPTASHVSPKSSTSSSSVKSTFSPPLSKSTSNPVSAKSTSSPAVTKSTSTHVSAKSNATPVSSKSFVTPVPEKSVAIPMSSKSLSTSVTAQPCPVSEAIVSTAVPTKTLSIPVSDRSSSTPTPEKPLVYTPFTAKSIAIPASDKPLSNNVSEKLMSNRVMENSSVSVAENHDLSSYKKHKLKGVNGIEAKKLKEELPSVNRRDTSNEKSKTSTTPASSWSPKQQRLRPRLMTKNDDSKAAKIRRSIPRFLGNPASGVKPMYNNNDVTEESPSTSSSQSNLRIDPKTLRPYVKLTQEPASTPLVTSPFIPRNKPIILPDPMLTPYNPMSLPPALHSSLPPTVSLPYRNQRHSSREDSSKT